MVAGYNEAVLLLGDRRGNYLSSVWRAFRAFSFLTVALEVRFSSPRDGAVFFFFFYAVDRLPDLQPSAAELWCCLQKLPTPVYVTND